MFIHDKLNVVKTHNADAQAQLFGILQDDALDLVADAERRIDGNAVAAVNAGALHQLHDARHEHVPAVADGVHFHFLAADVLIHQHRLVRIDFNRRLEVMAQLRFISDDLHGTSAQDEAGAHQDRIPDFLCRRHAVLDLCHGPALRLGNIQFQQDLLKRIPVFRPLNGIAVGADDPYAPLHEGGRQVNGRLAAQGGDDPLRLFKVDDGHDILRRQRLKVQLVRRGVVG